MPAKPNRDLQRAAAEELMQMAAAADISLRGDDRNRRLLCGQTLLEFNYDKEAALASMSERFGKKPAPQQQQNGAVEHRESGVKDEESKAQGKKGRAKKKKDEEAQQKATKPSQKRGRASKAKKEVDSAETDEEEEGEKAESTAKKPRKKAPKKEQEGEEAARDEEQNKSTKKREGKVCACPANHELANCFRAMGGHFFKEEDVRRGATYMKMYNALMDCPHEITSGKQAKQLPGIGDGAAKKIDEFLDTGVIQELEDIRGANQVVD